MSRDLKILIKNRGSVKRKLTSLEKFVDSIKTGSILPDLNNVHLRLENNLSLIKEFDEIQTIIEEIADEEDLSQDPDEREPFENKYYEAISFLRQYLTSQLPQPQPASRPNPYSAVTNDPLQNFLLPKIKLPVFNGEYENWLEFKKNFIATIDSNSNLSSGQKYNFLKASLEGYAKRVIEGCDEIQDYEKAWKTLNDKFNKQKFLIDTHLKCIFNIMPVTKGSFPNFRNMIDEISKHLSSLDGMKLGKEKLWDMCIIHIMYNKLDKITQNKWVEKATSSELPTLDNFLEFLKDRADILESLEECYIKQDTSQVNKKHFHKSSRVNLAIDTIKCNFCKGNHTIYGCADFLKLSVSNRWDKVKELKLCANCLRLGHVRETCYLGPCRNCKKKHNTLLHFENTYNNSLNAKPKGTTPAHNSNSFSTVQQSSATSDERKVVSYGEGEKQETGIYCGILMKSPTVLLSTVKFFVRDSQGKMQVCRALLDCGAQSNLITENFCTKLKLNVTPTNISIMGINQVTSHLTKKTSIRIYSRFEKFQIDLSCYVTSVISSCLPSECVDVSKLVIPDNLNLSDPEFYNPTEVDVLIGATAFWDILCDGKIKLNSKGPILQNTKLGWIVSGVIMGNLKNSICNFSKSVIPEDEQLKRFWEINEPPESIGHVLSKEDEECEYLFNQSTMRTITGQFIVKLPLKDSPDLLGDSKQIAIQRFNSLENRFMKNKTFYNLYKDFIHEYIELGHMSKLTNPDFTIPYYYFPHHGILKDSTTTRLRVVFDGSCVTTSGYSLNNIQYIGPKVQNNIFDILIRFRYFQFVVSADITKMYRQILMNEEHRPLQLILWRDSSTENLCTYQLNTVTYGTTAAPYLAIKCLKQLGYDNSETYPIASKTIIEDFYVDDLLSGSNDSQELQVRCKTIDDILKSGHFHLRKWASNDANVLAQIDHSAISNEILTLGEVESSKTLGIQWMSKIDMLTYKISSYSINNSITKRQVLSIISQIYDPLGLLSPVVIMSKIIIQRLWSMNVSWDEPIPESVYILWLKFYNQLSQLNKLKIPRHVIGNNYSLFDVHCFCDASSAAYACCIYLRSKAENGTFNVQLLCSKTKVSPLKVLTIPRLELCAALLGAQLMQQVLNALHISSEIPIYFWSDSQIVLCWLKKEPCYLQVFVANRVNKIQTMTNISNWHYVNTKDNPADLASRGVLPENLHGCQLWWQGPKFLYSSINCMIDKDIQIDIELPELKASKICFSSKTIELNEIFFKYSDLVKLKHVISYCFRFYSNLRKNLEERNLGPLLISEIESSFHRLIKLAQLESFPEEIALLKKFKTVPSNNRLSNLIPFLDNDGLLKVGGRLKFTSLDTNVKHPILLCSKHPLTKLIFTNYHNKLLHPGPQLLLASIRQRFWPLGGRNLARITFKRCLICFKAKPISVSAPMASLPDNRVTPSLPFSFTGIDYAGPFLLKNKAGRGAAMIKSYICVFICFCTKAIHLELVGSLSTEAFLSCLRRFISRRGIPSDIYSDNGKTFIGANNELQDIGKFLTTNHVSINEFFKDNNINWHFLPPYAPNFGGLWEAAVKSTKSHLKRLMLNKYFIYEEFNSLIIQIEGILNSRPLYAPSNDPNDLSPITPGHFLIGRPINSIPDTDLIKTPTARLSKLREIQQMYQQFWIRFTNEYVSQLHQQYKWKNPATPIKIDTLVLVQNSQQPPCKWLLGRIINLYTGKDGVSRVAVIKTSSGTITRSIRHCCPIPVEDELLK